MEAHKGVHKFEKIYQTVEDHSTDYTVKESDAGKLMVATKSGTFTFTLPPVATSEGCEFYFMQRINQTLVITAPANTMVAKNDVAATSVTYSTGSNKIGAACKVVCDGTRYFFFEMSGCTVSVS